MVRRIAEGNNVNKKSTDFRYVRLQYRWISMSRFYGRILKLIVEVLMFRVDQVVQGRIVLDVGRYVNQCQVKIYVTLFKINGMSHYLYEQQENVNNVRNYKPDY